ncbi:hypothetical protein DNTS_014626 [Danionella cerebrum]|uniref:Uncharacterized protein n=1 Tax=Danionella cerebrum TaxID=2873325 RepID=A0A553RED1_9TELE|nr:hypothetical protein DNTS_014626 [Danionella translucida]
MGINLIASAALETMASPEVSRDTSIINDVCICVFGHRLRMAQRAIKQTQVTVQKIGKEIEEKLRTTASCTEKSAFTLNHRSECYLDRTRGQPDLQIPPKCISYWFNEPESGSSFGPVSRLYKLIADQSVLFRNRAVVTSNWPQKKERECMQLRIGILRCELDRQRKALSREVDMMQKERAQLVKKEEASASKQRELESERTSLTELQKECTAKSPSISHLSGISIIRFIHLSLFLDSTVRSWDPTKLTFRCRQLISELSYIYPIDVNNQNDYVICGVKLPNSEDFQGKFGAFTSTPEEFFY